MGKTTSFHMQLSVEAARWPDPMLAHVFLKPNGTHATPAEARAELRRLKGEGFAVVPCGCPGSEAAPGNCPGIEAEVPFETP